MQFDIIHAIRYLYSRDVFLEPHEARMQPRNCGSQLLHQFDLEVDPTPAGTSRCTDVEGNNVTSLWFDGLHSELKVTARSSVRCIRDNPYDYLLRSSDHDLPLQYDPKTAQSLNSGLRCVASTEHENELATFATDLVRKSDGQLLPFLDLLNESIYTGFECIHREKGDAWPASYTFAERRGACRDLAVLFVAVCRCLGIAARFVSGYQEGDTEQEQRHLHAWAEVFVPGAGWRGYDPTLGLAVANRHVAVAASVSWQLTAPLVGSFRGDDVNVGMETQIDIQVNHQRQFVQQAQQQQE